MMSRGEKASCFWVFQNLSKTVVSSNKTLRFPATTDQHLRVAPCLALPTPTADEPLLANPGKQGEVGLADVVLAPVNELEGR